LVRAGRGKLTRAWVQFVTAGASPSREEVKRGLSRAGVELYAPRPGPCTGPGLIVSDGVTPDLLNLIRETSRGGIDRVLVLATSAAGLEPSGPWALLKAGAADVLTWDDAAEASGEITARFSRWEEVDDLVRSSLVSDNLVGRSTAWTALLRQIVEVARFSNASMLITGESGTGKELVARLVHTLDPRPNKGDLVILDCTTVVPTLSGSEFFGHEKGAFTGAALHRDGAFAIANGGTLFLDEVGDLPLTLQAELLRVIQEGTYKRVGSNAWKKTTFRLICATNRDLLEEESHGRFRRDFYYRIAAWTCRMPPIRERREDVPLLTEHFLRQLRPVSADLRLDPAVWELLAGRDYPGNARDLRQLVARISTRHVGPGPITVGDVPPEERPTATIDQRGWWDEGFERAIRQAVTVGASLKDIGEVATETAVRIALTQEGGNLPRAARRLGVTARALQLRRARRQAAPATAAPLSVVVLPESEIVGTSGGPMAERSEP
jgi:transcriptional regulator with GAF, ATPase, and Fis domain